MPVYDGNDPNAEEKMARMAQFMGPGQIDQEIRSAIQLCWMSLAKDRRTLKEVEKQIRRLVDRALKDFREDQAAFRK